VSILDSKIVFYNKRTEEKAKEVWEQFAKTREEKGVNLLCRPDR
jgi:hypothetical protein